MSDNVGKEKKMGAETQELCNILEALVNGLIQPDAAIDRINALSMDGLEGLYGNLFHYLDDADIRKRDSRYRELQDSEVKKLISYLKAGELDKANAISFLEKTG